MTQEDLINAIIEFASLDDSALAKRSAICFWIDIQPNSLIYGGEFQFDESEYKPIDLKKIGKYNCHLFTNFLQNFHHDNTNNGRNKWNRARVDIRFDGAPTTTFIWDQEWEENETKGYLEMGSERGKWYWDEK